MIMKAHACSVEVEHGVEGARVAVEEVLVVDERVRVAELHDLLVRLGGGEEAEARARVEEQRRPQDLSIALDRIERGSWVGFGC